MIKEHYMAQHAIAVNAAWNSKEVTKLVKARDESQSMYALGIRTKLLGFLKKNPPVAIIEVTFDFSRTEVGIMYSDVKVVVNVDPDHNAEVVKIDSQE